MFQYKVIQNVLPTRATLYRSGIFEKPIYAKTLYATQKNKCCITY